MSLLKAMKYNNYPNATIYGPDKVVSNRASGGQCFDVGNMHRNTKNKQFFSSAKACQGL